METKLKIAKGLCFSALALCGVDISSTLYVDAKTAVTTEIHERWVAGFKSVATKMGYAPKVVISPIDARKKVIKASVENGVNPDLMLAQWQVESRGDRLAQSPAGAIGHMQIMPVNAVKLCGYKHSVELFDEDKNIACGVRFMASLLRDYKWDVPSALKAYNGGPKCVANRCAESEAYVKLVLSELAKNVKGEA